LLCEESESLDRTELLDFQEIPDYPLGVFRVDIGMFPDARYLDGDDDLQDLAPTDPRRLRALIAEYLSSLQHQGHCFAAVSEIADYVLNAPLFYRRGLPFNEAELLEPESLAHSGEILHVEQRETESYFYLKGLKAAEDVVRRVVDSLLQRGDHEADKTWIAKYVAAESSNVKKRAPQGFDENKFTAERRHLLEGALSASLFVVTGEPGSGKTFAIRTIAERLLAARESVVVLAPTGKAALRLKREGGFAEAQTIDRYLARLGVLGVTDDLRQLHDMKRPETAEIIHNLIIDESSMIDLPKLAVLCRLLELQKLPSLRRFILVGDENQLPPIGFGRPFHDIVAYMRADKRASGRNAT
jgi:exodeoxyribonuclease V alpha subunit